VGDGSWMEWRRWKGQQDVEVGIGIDWGGCNG
jgi:hypothetical protein